MNPTALLLTAQELLAESLSGAVTTSMGTLSLGFRTPSGRELPLSIEELPNGDLLVSDVGESWSDLVMEGFVNFAPNSTELSRLHELARMYAVYWNEKSTAFEVTCALHDLGGAARRITMASIGLSGWRALTTHISPPNVEIRRRVVSEACTVAVTEGWLAHRKQRMPGRSGHAWPTPLVLVHNAAKVAVRFEEGTPDKVIERAIGCVLDTNVAAVIVAASAVVDRIAPSFELRNARIELVRRLPTGTGQLVFDGARRLAA